MRWQASCSSVSLKARAELYAWVRAFFSSRQVLEVETPVLSQASATDPHLQSVQAEVSLTGQQATPFYLQTSPEFAMKRLLASGSGDIFQICKTFRDAEVGPRHNPEFSMLEWYRLDYSLLQLMDEVEQLIQVIPGLPPAVHVHYRDVFLQYLAIDPFEVSDRALAEQAERLSGYTGPAMARDDYLNLLLSQHIEPNLGLDAPTFLVGYPASQASLAKLVVSDAGHVVAERFELYLNGLEIANGYHELTDAKEQAKRFAADNVLRQQMGLETVTIDKNLLAAMNAGLPACSGVALGLDRLLMVKQGANTIEEVLAFPIERA